MRHIPSDDAVVLALLRRPSDEERLLSAGTYHLPASKSAPLLGARTMVWYVPAWHPVTPWSVRYRAEISAGWLTTRRLYLPEEAVHPRANELYWIVRVAGLEVLDPVLPSLRWRRVGVHRLQSHALLRATELGEVASLSRRIPTDRMVWEW